MQVSFEGMSTRVVVTLGAACFTLVGLSVGCAETEEQSVVVRVEAPSGKCWSSAVGDSTGGGNGCGPKSFSYMTNDAYISANAVKLDPGKWELRLILEVDGEVVSEASTTEEPGVAFVSE
jgi:hypothetical protein